MTRFLLALALLLVPAVGWADDPPPAIGQLRALPNATSGTVLHGDGTWSGVGGGSGTVTGASVVTANGLAGTVANASTTPAFTLTTTITGMLKGSGGALTGATAGTDYLSPTGSGAGLTGLTWGQLGSTPTTLSGYGITVTGTGAAVQAASPTISGPTITGSFTATGLVTNSALATMAAFTTKCNATGSTAAPTDCPSPPFTISNASTEPAFFVGPFAGASMPTGASFLSGIGPYAGESVSVMIDELELVGHGSGIAIISGGGVAFGTSSCAAETTSACFAIGADAARDFYQATDLGSMAIGNGALGDGSGTGVDIAIGGGALWGAAASITFTNSAPHVGDVYTLSTNTSNACNGTTIVVNCTTNSNNPGTVASTWPVTNTYTVVAGDTTATILVGHLASAWSGANNVNYILGDGVQEGTHNLFPYSWQQADITNHPTVLKGHYPGSWLVTPTVSCSGTCTNAQATVGSGYTGGHNVLIGSKLFNSPLVAAPQYNTIVGDSGPGNFVVSNSGNTFFGYNIAPGLASGGNGGSDNTVYGASAGNSITTASRQVLFGYYAGASITTGTGNHVFSDQGVAGQNCITSGSNNLELGEGACVPTATASSQMSIQNGIYGLNLSGTGSTVSPGQIGIMNAAPTAVLDIKGPDTSTTLAFRVQNSTPSNVLSVTDAGVIAVGSGAFTANGSVATTMTSLGPTGSHATIQEWFTVTDSIGNVRYIPAY